MRAKKASSLLRPWKLKRWSQYIFCYWNHSFLLLCLSSFAWNGDRVAAKLDFGSYHYPKTVCVAWKFNVFNENIYSFVCTAWDFILSFTYDHSSVQLIVTADYLRPLVRSPHNCHVKIFLHYSPMKQSPAFKFLYNHNISMIPPICMISSEIYFRLTWAQNSWFNKLKSFCVLFYKGFLPNPQKPFYFPCKKFEPFNAYNLTLPLYATQFSFPFLLSLHSLASRIY